jgi:hypothetical protein
MDSVIIFTIVYKLTIKQFLIIYIILANFKHPLNTYSITNYSLTNENYQLLLS